MDFKIDLDKHIRKCITIITCCVLLVMCAFFSVFTYVSFFEEEGPDLRPRHIQQQDDEGEMLDSIIDVLENINKNLEGHE